MSVNKIIILGRLGSDPEMKYTNSGKAVANFTVATSENWTDKSGQKQEKTEWHRVVVWEALAETCKKYLSKGREIYLEGQIQTRQWDDKDGQKRYTTEIVGKSVQFIGSSKSDNKPQQNMMDQNYQPETNQDFTAADIPF